MRRTSSLIRRVPPASRAFHSTPKPCSPSGLALPGDARRQRHRHLRAGRRDLQHDVAVRRAAACSVLTNAPPRPMSRSTPALSLQRARDLPQHRNLDRQPLVAAGDHLGRVAARDAQQVVARLRLARQELDADAGLGLRAVLAGAAPRDLTADQRRAATPAEADRRRRRSRRSRAAGASGKNSPPCRRSRQVAFQERRAVGKMRFEDGHVGK